MQRIAQLLFKLPSILNAYNNRYSLVTISIKCHQIQKMSHSMSASMIGEFSTTKQHLPVRHMSTPSSSTIAKSDTNVIVNYLPLDMSEAELQSLFQENGSIESVVVIRNMRTKSSMGYGFVNFTRKEDAENAVKNLNGTTIGNKRLKVSFALKNEEGKTSNLYIANLPSTITEEELESTFGKYGEIVAKNIIRDTVTGEPRGIAFVRYNTHEEANNAILALNNTTIKDSVHPLIVRLREARHKTFRHNAVYNNRNNLGLDA